MRREGEEMEDKGVHEIGRTLWKEWCGRGNPFYMCKNFSNNIRNSAILY